MARWKLLNSHYLNVPNEEWEYVENDRKTGRPIRHKFPVPRLLDPKDPSCWTSRWGSKDNEEGVCVVCHEGKGESGDIVFFGNPTPDMMPVDDEAKAISASFEHQWSYKPETDIGTYSQSLVDKFQIEMAEKQAKPQPVEGLAELTSAMTQMVKQNQELITSLARRV